MHVYQVITDSIMDKLAKGVIPWQKPWNHTAGISRNLLSQKPYKGINVWILAATGYASPYWLTYKQALDIGGHVKKGEHGAQVVFWKWLDTKEEVQEGEEDRKHAPIARLYTVFNAQQCELPERLQSLVAPSLTTGNDTARQITACEEILAHIPHPPAIQQREARAYYSPGRDMVNMPEQRLFPKLEHYYSVLFHELTHSTGHRSRLNRDTLNDLLAFGDTNYSKEELVAEMGAAYLCRVAGIANETLDNSAAYIQGWLGKLRTDKRLLIHAAAQAQKAADWILNHSAV
jgi:antirestriction protein ArdC